MTTTQSNVQQMNYILFAFGVCLSIFGVFMFVSSVPSSSPMSFGTRPNYGGILGFMLSLFGILIMIIAGILIERAKRVHACSFL